MNRRPSTDADIRTSSRRFGFARVRVSRQECGAALLFVLTITGLLSVVLVMALLRANKSVEMASLNEGREEALSLAHTAWRRLVENLQTEIRAGSKNPEYAGEPAVVVTVETNTAPLKYSFYYPAAALNAVPCPSTTSPNLPPNLLKWSTRNAAFFGEWGGRSYPFKDRFPPAIEAAPVSTEDLSLNGIKISPQRWNLPLLLPKKDRSASSTNTYPDFPGAPDWVLFSRSGETPRDLDQNGADPVVGRYAYMIYNEGGLLDLNTAGVPSELGQEALAFKGTLRLADLMPIMEESGFKGREQNDFADALLKWRDAGRVEDANFPINYAEDLLLNPLSSPRRVASPRSPRWVASPRRVAPNDWVGDPNRLLWVAKHWCGDPKCSVCYPAVIDTGNVPRGGQSNNRALIGRRALIQKVLSQNIGSLGARQNFLQYVGTFGRSLDQPSLVPTQPGGFGPPKLKDADAGGNSESNWDNSHPSHAEHLNPPFLQVRVKHEFRRADGTWAYPGEPLVKRRFALTHLTEVGYGKVGKPDKTSRPWVLFGLSRDQPKDPWHYQDNRILTLGEVADLPEESAREANFMELLKAAIYAGVLAGELRDGEPREERQEWEKSLDCAVIQIAANLIDQYDDDSLPTGILMPLPEGGEKEFHGIEALPYLHGVQSHLTIVNKVNGTDSNLPSPASVVPAPPGGGDAVAAGLDKGKVLFWQSFALWNPHLQDSNSPAYASDFALDVKSEVPFYMAPYLSGGTEILHGGGTITFQHEPTPLSATAYKALSQSIYFKWPLHAPGAFDDPVWLPGPNNSALGVDSDPGNAVDVGTMSGAIGIAESTRIFAKFNPIVPGKPNSRFGVVSVLPTYYRIKPVSDLVLTYSLKIKDANGNWIVYDEKRLGLGPEFKSGNSWTLFIDSDRSDDSWRTNSSFSNLYWASMFPDPRTERWGGVRVPNNTVSIDYERVPWFSGVPNPTGLWPGPVTDADGLFRRPFGALSPGFWLPDDKDAARPRVLNRPFRSIGEMAFAFAGAPWRHVDFAAPESGFGGLLDVFCISELEDLEPLKSGRLDLNTRQLPVVKALLSGTGWNVDHGQIKSFSSVERDGIAQMLLNRTKGAPVRNVSELAGFWSPKSVGGRPGVGEDFYDGFAKDLLNVTLSLEGGAQYKQAAIRALADAGQTRVWNLMLDLIVQSGKYPQGMKPPLSQFIVTGEARIWVHVAIDRLTGEVLDSQVEYPQE